MATWEPQEAICEAEEAKPVILEPHKVGSSNKSGQWLISCLSSAGRVCGWQFFLFLGRFIFLGGARGSVWEGERLKLLKTLDPMCLFFLVSYNLKMKVTPRRPKTRTANSWNGGTQHVYQLKIGSSISAPPRPELFGTHKSASDHPPIFKAIW